MKTKRDYFFHALLVLAIITVTTVYLFFIGSIVFNGLPGADFNFLIEAPLQAGRSGGINSVLTSTLMILLVCLLTVVPIGLGAGYYLVEFSDTHQRAGSFIRWSLNILASSPSIVFGLFGNIFFCVYLKFGFSILSGGLTLACMCLPFFIYSVEHGLRSVSPDIKKSARALDLSKTTTLFKILLPASKSYITTGLLICIARAVSETAALIFTSGSVDRMPDSFLDSGRSLSVHIYELSMNVTGGDQNAYRSAFVLLILVLVINSIATSLAKSKFKVLGAQT